MKKIFLNILVLLIIFCNLSLSQVDLVPVSNPVYLFLKRMELKNIIAGYNSSNIPLSRKAISVFLKNIAIEKDRLNKIDKYLLEDFLTEYSFEVNGNFTKSSFPGKEFNLLANNKKKYIYAYSDSNAAFFIDGFGKFETGASSGDSLGRNSIGIGSLGIRARGTLYGSLGFFFQASHGWRIYGGEKGAEFAKFANPELNSKHKFVNEGFIEDYTGYLRYATDNEWFGLTIGKERIHSGFGYNDKLFISGNSIPFSFLKLDMKYKIFNYNFLYGSLKGDSLGHETFSKYITMHRVGLNFSDAVKFGFYESLIISDRSFDFTFLNPFSFIRAADYDAGIEQSDLNNALMGMDFEIHPARNFSFSGSLLIDDFNISNLFSNEKRPDGLFPNDNRFGYQIGSIWTDAFFIPNLTLTTEYTKLSPFIYTHRTNKSQYTNWSLPIGHNLPPNSDEISIKMDYYITNRLFLSLNYQHIRHAEGFEFKGDSLIRNYGGNLNRGDSDLNFPSEFLAGNRINYDFFTLNLLWQPILQYYFNLKIVYLNNNLLYLNKSLKDVYFWFMFKIDI